MTDHGQMLNGSHTVPLTGAELLVLHAALCKINADDAPRPALSDAEERVLWDLEATLEKLNAAWFLPPADMQAIQQAAENRILGRS